MNQGWICPKCGKVYAPTQMECFGCNSNINDWPNSPAWPVLKWLPPYTTFTTFNSGEPDE